MSPILPIGRPDDYRQRPRYSYSHGVILIITAYLLTCFSPQTLFGNELSTVPRIADQDRQYDYAQSLFEKGYFAKAAAEFDRFVFFFPSDPRIPKARYLSAHAYFKGGRYEDVVVACKAVINEKPNGIDTVQYYLLLARTRIKQEDFNQALITLHNILSIFQDSATRDEARYLGAWIFIQTAQWPKALTWLQAISSENRDVYAAESISEKLATIDTIPQKSPRLAGCLAVIPGMGHLYTGRYQDALTALLLNGLTIWGAYEAFEDDHPGLGSLLSLVGLNLYVGNLYSAVNASHQFNRRANEQFIKRFPPLTHFRLSLGPKNGGGVVMVAFDF